MLQSSVLLIHFPLILTELVHQLLLITLSFYYSYKLIPRN